MLRLNLLPGLVRRRVSSLATIHRFKHDYEKEEGTWLILHAQICEYRTDDLLCLH